MRSLIIFLFLLSNAAFAFRLKPMSILPNNDGVVFHFSNYIAKGSQIFAYSKGADGKFSLSALLNVTSCNLETCDAKILKLKKGSLLSDSDYFSTKKIGGGLKNTSSRESAKRGFISKDLIFATYGGPLAFGVSAAWLKDWSTEFKFGLGAGLISADVGNVAFSGKYFDLIAEYQVWSMEEWQLHPYFQLGYLMTTLDFSSVNGTKISANAPFAGAGMNLRYEWTDWFFIFRGGYSYNKYESSYSDDNGSYSTPANRGIIVFETGLGYRF